MPNLFVSLATLVTILIGIVISIVYLRYMWLALQRVARTLDDPDNGESDSFGYSFLGAIIAVAATVENAHDVRIGVAGMSDRPAVRRIDAGGASSVQDAVERLAWELRGYEDIHASAHMRRDLLRRIAPVIVEEAMRCAA